MSALTKPSVLVTLLLVYKHKGANVSSQAVYVYYYILLSFLHLSFLPAFLQLVFQPFISTHTGFSIGAWQPSGRDY